MWIYHVLTPHYNSPTSWAGSSAVGTARSRRPQMLSPPSPTLSSPGGDTARAPVGRGRQVDGIATH
jgi:hypothetical protein